MLPPSERRRVREQVPAASRERWALALAHIEHIQETSSEHSPPSQAHVQPQPPRHTMEPPPPSVQTHLRPGPHAAPARPFDLGGLQLWLEQWRLMRLMPKLQVTGERVQLHFQHTTYNLTLS